MKLNMIYAVGFLFLMSSCEKAKELRYDNELSTLNIWLGANLQMQDSLVYNYAFKSLNESDTIKFSVRLSGLPGNQDREFKLKAISGDLDRVKEGVHYVFPKYILKANTYEGVFPILIKRSADFKNKEARVVFALSENESFKKGVREQSSMKVILKEEFSKPANWDVEPYPYTRLSTFFGAYSNVKFQFITTVIGRIPTFRVRSAGVPVPPDEVYYTQAQYWQSRCKLELAKYNAEHPGQPLKDGDETIVFP
ncbi:DUF4843 domain-containing protein [Pedobacter frigoris]|uniref:DUF4843 domain-containing protein n=1 Tax=Pedobacter frigoris TaxID=2571272 RepID=A0A4U1CSA1_9SPHI|nr:DUF4843 domain-containing protein [Pedobacter frigoris]TKC08598.1 DUF4843 domain-containing protein [Pedobacter frigoris]